MSENGFTVRMRSRKICPPAQRSLHAKGTFPQFIKSLSRFLPLTAVSRQ